MVETRKIFTFYSFVLSYLVPLLCVWFFYSRIIYSLFVKRRRRGPRPRPRHASKVTVMVLAIVSAYTIFWFPFWFVQLSIEMRAKWTNDVVTLVCISYSAYALQYINSALNPFLYAFLTNAFLNNLKQSFSGARILEPRNRAEDDENSVTPTTPDVSKSVASKCHRNFSAVFSPKHRNGRRSTREIISTTARKEDLPLVSLFDKQNIGRYRGGSISAATNDSEKETENSDNHSEPKRFLIRNDKSWVAVLVQETEEVFL